MDAPGAGSEGPELIIRESPHFLPNADLYAIGAALCLVLAVLGARAIRSWI